jgi:hypothetical protein
MNLKVNDAQNCLFHIKGYMVTGDSPRSFADIQVWMSKVPKENAANSNDKSNSAGQVSCDSGTDLITKMLGQKRVASEDSEAAPMQGVKAGSKEPAPGSPPRVASASAAVASPPPGGRAASTSASPARKRTAAGTSQSSA